MERKDNCVCVFVRNPVLGKVKTRIAHEVGDEEALKIYKKLLEVTLNNAISDEWDTIIYLSDTVNDLKEFDLPKKIQAKGNLGVKLACAFTDLLQEYKKVFVVGSDCPTIRPNDYRTGFAELEDHQLVLGPSTDGGYYLIGLRKSAPFLFQNIDWSTDKVLSQTIALARQKLLSLKLLTGKTDIDHYEDWINYLEEHVKI
jgi:hypothetical protein